MVPAAGSVPAGDVPESRTRKPARWSVRTASRTDSPRTSGTARGTIGTGADFTEPGSSITYDVVPSVGSRFVMFLAGSYDSGAGRSGPSVSWRLENLVSVTEVPVLARSRVDGATADFSDAARSSRSNAASRHQ